MCFLVLLILPKLLIKLFVKLLDDQVDVTSRYV